MTNTDWVLDIAYRVRDLTRKHGRERFQEMILEWNRQRDAAPTKGRMGYKPDLPLLRMGDDSGGPIGKTLPEKFAVLAAIHDGRCVENQPLNPWASDSGDLGSVGYYSMVRTVGSGELARHLFADELQRELEAVLDDVTAELVDNDDPGNSATKEETPAASLTWHEVQQRLLVIRDCGELFPGFDNLADRLRCSKATIHKAIRPPQSALERLEKADRGNAVSASRKLAGWQARSSSGTGSPRASSLTEVVLGNAEQIREADPAQATEGIDVDAVLARLIDDAGPEERARLNGLSDEELRTVAKLYLEQQADEEPSPLEDDPPSKQPIRVKAHKRV